MWATDDVSIMLERNSMKTIESHLEAWKILVSHLPYVERAYKENRRPDSQSVIVSLKTSGVL